MNPIINRKQDILYKDLAVDLTAHRVSRAGRGIWNFLKRGKSALHGKKVQGALRFQLALFRR